MEVKEDRIAELEKRLAEAEARAIKAEEERDFFREVLDTINTTVSVIDAKGEVLFINRCLLGTMQATLEQLKGTNSYTRPEIPERDVELTKYMVSLVLGGAAALKNTTVPQRGFNVITEGDDVVLTGETFIGTVQGVDRWRLGNISGIRREGAVKYVVFTSTDITDRKRAETALAVAKEQAESANALKDQYVALVSHDLRSPLAAMMGALNIALPALDGAVKPEIARLLSMCQRNCAGLLDMISRLLDIDRLKSGHVKLNKSFHSAAAMTEQAFARLDSLAAEKKIRLVNNVPPAARLFVDGPLFLQVIQNLAANAIKFCGEGASVTVSMNPNTPSTLTVADDGPGIKPELEKDLFNPSVTTTTRGTKGERGNGLGLPLCQNIMKAHGGELLLENSPGKGAVFHCHTPPVKAAVLVVEDQPAARERVCELVKAMGVEVMEAQNGREALTMAAITPPNLVITDVNMPVMGGLELLDNLKAQPHTANVPVIVMTSSGEGAGFREEVFRRGADDFVLKPIHFDDFTPRVKRFVSA